MWFAFGSGFGFTFEVWGLGFGVYGRTWQLTWAKDLHLVWFVEPRAMKSIELQRNLNFIQIKQFYTK